MDQKGFIPIIFIVIGAVVITSAIFGVVKYKKEPAMVISNVDIVPEVVVEEVEVIKEVEVVKEVEVIKEVIKEVPVTVSEESASKPVFFNIPASNEPAPESTPGLDSNLIIQSLNFYPPKPIEGDIVTFWAIIKNQGQGNAVDSSAVRLSINGNFWNEAAAAGLASNKAENVVWDKKWKAISGKYVIEACVEVNNCIETNLIVSRILDLPDYIISSNLMIPADPNTGDILSFSAIVKNQGRATGIGSSLVSFYLDINNDGRWDITTKDGFVDVLVPSGKEKEYWKFVWAATPGTHKYEICADSGSNIKESNETNNCKSARFVIK